MMKTHKKLKNQASQWLGDKGFIVTTELAFGKDRVDVVGQKESITVGIECGNTSYKKLMRLSKILDNLYVWLYYDQDPIIFTGQIIKYRSAPDKTKTKRQFKPSLDELHKQYDLYFPRAFRLT